MTMTNRTTSIRSIAAGTFFILGSFCFVQCSSHEDGGDGGAMQHQGQRADGTNVDPVTGAELNREVNATYAEQQASMHADGQGGTVTTTTVIVYTPAKERMMATNDMRGLRSLLMADLEAVRTRLGAPAAFDAVSKQFTGVGGVVAERLKKMLDLGDDAAVEGDEVVLFGDGQDGVPLAEDWAQATGTIGYEIVTRLGPRVPRVYVGGGS